MVDEDDIEECLSYTHEAERRYYDIKERVSLLTQPLSTSTEMLKAEVSPEDSVNEIISHLCVTSMCSKNSKKSSRSALRDVKECCNKGILACRGVNT